MSTVAAAVELDPRNAWRIAKRNAIQYAKMFGIVFLVLFAMSEFWVLGAKTGFWLTVPLIAFGCFQALIGLVGTIVLNVAGETRPGERWIVASCVLRVAQEATGLVLLILTYSRLWP